MLAEMASNSENSDRCENQSVASAASHFKVTALFVRLQVRP